VLHVYTTEPSVHLYTGNFIDDNSPGKNGAKYMRRSGFCLETQHYPDAPNHAHFPTTVLRAGETFSSKTIFEFTTDAI
jgi:aldose 1-epimerase